MKYPPQLEALVNEARAVTCEDWARKRGWKLRRSGPNLSGPCPKCGGTDRFAIQAKDDKWHCRGCGVGGHDAISLVMLVDNQGLHGTTMGETFLEACEVITGRSRQQILSQEEVERREREMKEKRARQEREADQYRQRVRKSAWNVWRAANAAGDMIAGYLKARGIETDPGRLVNELDYDGTHKARSSVRESPQLVYWHNKREMHKGPAMVLAMQWADGRFGGVHRTWIDIGPSGKKGKAVIIDGDEALDSKKMLGSKGNGAIRIFTPPDARRIIMGEGFETTLTPYVHAFEKQTAYWMGLDIGHIAGRAARDKDTGKLLPAAPDMNDKKCFMVPIWCEELVLILDGDSDKRSTSDAIIRAAKRQRALLPGLAVKVANPGDGIDMNDLVMQRAD